jgi:signal transduction histidine kinase
MSSNTTNHQPQNDPNQPGVFSGQHALPQLSGPQISRPQISGDQSDASAGEQHPPKIIIIDDNTAIHDDFRKILDGSPAAETDSRLADLEMEILGGEVGTATPAGKGSQPRYELHSAYQGKDGYEMVRDAVRTGRPYCTAFVDMRMPPGWDGVETIQKLWEADPHLQVLICTAYSSHSWEEIAQRLGHSDQLLILRKPFDPAEVSQIAASMTEKWRLAKMSREMVQGLEKAVAQKTREIRAQMTQRERVQQQLLEKEKQLRESQKLEAIGSLAGGVAHEFNNLLQIIQSFNQFALDACKPLDPMRKDLQSVAIAAKRASSLTRKLLGFSRQKNLQFVDLDVNEVVGEIIGLAEPLVGSRITMANCLGAEKPTVHADATELQQVLLNCIINARDAMDGAGQLFISTDNTYLDENYCRVDQNLSPGLFVCIYITDTGSGMSPEVQRRIFEPFYTTKQVGSGTGLGMAMAYGLIKQHKGHIDVDSEVGKGTTFKIYLPVQQTAVSEDDGSNDEQSLNQAAGLGAEHAEPQGATILVADDEPLLQQVSKRILESKGHRVLLASDGPSAVEMVTQHADELDLVVMDVMMPNLTGTQAEQQIHRLCPDLQVIFCTGHAPGSEQGGGLPQGFPVIRKPFEPDELLKVVQQTLKQSRG